MNPKTFYIQCNEPAKSLLFKDEYGVGGLSALEFALWKFTDEHNRNWSIFVNGLELQFEYSPDLTTIFIELPNVLESLLQHTKEPVILDLFEEGTALTLCLKRENDKISVKFQKIPPLTAPKFAHLPPDPQTVFAIDFYIAWFDFLDELLETLVKQNPKLAGEQSYLEYTYRINQIKRKVFSNIER